MPTGPGRSTFVIMYCVLVLSCYCIYIYSNHKYDPVMDNYKKIINPIDIYIQSDYPNR